MSTEVPEIPDVPEQIPGQSEIDLPNVLNPYLGVWWSTQTVSNVPENVMGWLVAQGYQVSGITQDTTTVPPTNYFSLTKEGMQPRDVIRELCNSYTIAANEARTANEIRYNEIRANWTTMIDTTHDHFRAQTEQQNAQAGIFFSDLDGYMNAIDTLIADNQSQIGFDAAEAKTALMGMDLRLTELEDNAASNATVIEGLLTDQETNLQAYLDDYDARLAELEQNVIDHIDTVLTQVDSLAVVLKFHISDYAQQFDMLLVNYNLHVADIGRLTTNLSDNINTYTTDVAAILTAIYEDYDAVEGDLDGIRTNAGSLVSSHVADYSTVLALLTSDYALQEDAVRSIINFLIPDHTANASATRTITGSLEFDHTTHSSVTTGLLDGLGTTETARITEEAAARLAVQMQMLVSKGLYMSTIPVDITQRNWRDRDEQIQLHRDRLMREKLENEHRLYEQQRATRGVVLDNEHRIYEQLRAVRGQSIDAENRLYEQQVGVRTRTLEGKNQVHTVQQEVLRYQASLITGTYNLQQEAKNRVLAGKQAIFAAKDANERLSLEVQPRLYSQLQDIKLKTIEATDRIYQLRDIYAKWENSETHRTYEQLQQIRQLFLESVGRKLAAKQDVTRGEMSQRDTLLQQIQAALTGLLGGKERFSTLLLQNANTLAEHKHRAILERMNTAIQRLDGWKSIADENRKLMLYQLDERNKLLVGLYSFVERREDIGPEWKDQATMIAALGDSAGGWVTP